MKFVNERGEIMSNKNYDLKHNNYPSEKVIPMIPEQSNILELSMQDMMDIFTKLCKLAGLKRNIIKLNNEIIESLTNFSDSKGNVITIADAENIINGFLSGKYEIFDEYFRIKDKKQK